MMPEEHHKIIAEIKDLILREEKHREQWLNLGDMRLYHYCEIRIWAFEEVIQRIFDMTYGED